MTFKTEAIVLYERPFVGADKLYELLSPRYGKISAVGRSAAKSSSKLAGHMRPFSHLTVMIGRGKNDHLAAVSEIQRFKNIHASFADFILASSLVELILRVNVSDQAAPLEFELLRGALLALDQIDQEKTKRVLIGRVFLWKLLMLAGWQPALDHCAVCRKQLEATSVHFDEQQGFVCAEHAAQDSLTQELVHFLKTLNDSNDWESSLAQAVELPDQKQWFELSQKYYHHVVNQPIRSLALFPFTR